MTEIPRQLTPEELRQWEEAIQAADRHSILCHCHECEHLRWSEAYVNGSLLL
ncbi:hypothetical protein [Leptolyngbya sp. FACHB-17]|uniref:hypothetical protein n=1 Tax=unclassified Leptolyngbya TaxID=2650499 RepID=UPI001F55A3A7|nr:hypothetical protein [Leptolyngbya sp. FACHB-17]